MLSGKKRPGKLTALSHQSFIRTNKLFFGSAAMSDRSVRFQVAGEAGIAADQ